MKKIGLLIVSLIVAAFPSRGQDTLDIPYGTFESWERCPADSLSLMGGMVRLPINYERQMPIGWNVPLYDFCDTLSYSGMAIPVSMSMPLAVVTPDTLHAPQGSRAVVAHTFRFEDVMTPDVYSMAQGLLDSTLTTMVLPTVLATGQINLDSIIPLIARLTGNVEDLSWMLEMVDSIDLNKYLSGGFPLNGFSPGKLIGRYKYRDPGEGDDDDNGLVVVFGTRYDTLTHRRVLVGAGVKKLFELYDTVNYEPFELEYTSLSSYFPESYGFYDADSMVVMLISSASAKGFQYGSRLYVDDLRLVERPAPCGRVCNLRAETNAPRYIHLTWNNTRTPDGWQIEYGPTGFVLGHGTSETLTDSNAYFYSLETNTSYDFYVRGVCGDTAETEWVHLRLRTAGSQGIEPAAQPLRCRLYPNPALGSCTVSLSAPVAASVRLYGMQGTLLQQMATQGLPVTLTLPHSGIYVVEVVSDQWTERMRVVGQ